MLGLYLRLANALRSEEGQDVVEYALLVVLIAVALIAIFPQVASAVSSALQQAINGLQGG
jgi:Flp pilus assembly pilin Flp